MSEHFTENGAPLNYLAPDGYRYGVMFHDGSVAECWNGKTQREQAQHEAARRNEMFPRDRITLARRKPGESWSRIIPPATTDGGAS